MPSQDPEKHADVWYMLDTPPETGASCTQTRRVEQGKLGTRSRARRGKCFRRVDYTVNFLLAFVRPANVRITRISPLFGVLLAGPDKGRPGPHEAVDDPYLHSSLSFASYKSVRNAITARCGGRSGHRLGVNDSGSNRSGDA